MSTKPFNNLEYKLLSILERGKRLHPRDVRAYLRSVIPPAIADAIADMVESNVRLHPKKEREKRKEGRPKGATERLSLEEQAFGQMTARLYDREKEILIWLKAQELRRQGATEDQINDKMEAIERNAADKAISNAQYWHWTPTPPEFEGDIPACTDVKPKKIVRISERQLRRFIADHEQAKARRKY